MLNLYVIIAAASLTVMTAPMMRMTLMSLNQTPNQGERENVTHLLSVLWH